RIFTVPSCRVSPTTAQTFDVPISNPTMISSLAMQAEWFLNRLRGLAFAARGGCFFRASRRRDGLGFSAARARFRFLLRQTRPGRWNCRHRVCLRLGRRRFGKDDWRVAFDEE